MGSTFVPFYVHFIWSTRERIPIFHHQKKNEIEQLLLSIAKDLKLVPVEIYAMPDHLHFLVKLSATQNISEVAGHLKRRSSKLFNDRHPKELKWQTGYAAFPISYNHVEKVKRYIKNQHEHHKKVTFKEEYLNWLDSYKVEYQIEYVFAD